MKVAYRGPGAARLVTFAGMPFRLLLAAAAALALLATPASAAPPAPGNYRADDFAGGSAYNIIPPGRTASRARRARLTSWRRVTAR